MGAALAIKEDRRANHMEWASFGVYRRENPPPTPKAKPKSGTVPFGPRDPSVRIRSKEVVAVVSILTGASVEDICSGRRSRSLTPSRRTAAVACFLWTERSLPAIGKSLNRDHSTVLYHINEASRRLAQGRDRDGLERHLANLERWFGSRCRDFDLAKRSSLAIKRRRRIVGDPPAPKALTPGRHYQPWSQGARYAPRTQSDHCDRIKEVFDKTRLFALSEDLDHRTARRVALAVVRWTVGETFAVIAFHTGTTIAIAKYADLTVGTDARRNNRVRKAMANALRYFDQPLPPCATP